MFNKWVSVFDRWLDVILNLSMGCGSTLSAYAFTGGQPFFSPEADRWYAIGCGVFAGFCFTRAGYFAKKKS
jgi:hypothetical protein